MYLSYEMLRNLAPREMTAREQRQVDEQMGQVAAAAARWTRHVAAQVHAMAGRPVRGHRPATFRKSGLARRRTPYRA